MSFAYQGMNQHTSAKKRQQLFAIIFLVVIALGSIAALILNGQNQDSRQQASEGVSTTRITTEPAPQTFFQTNTTSTLDFVAHIPANRPLHGIQFNGMITGSFSSAPTITAKTIPGLSVVVQTITQKESGYQISLAFIPTSPSAPFVSEATQVVIGSLSFSAQQAGAITIVPDTTLTKIIDATTSDNLILQAAPMSYTACSDNCPTPPESPNATPVTTIPTANAIAWTGSTSQLQAENFYLQTDSLIFTSTSPTPTIETYHNYTTGLSTIEYKWLEHGKAVTLALDVKKTFEQDKWIVEQIKSRIGDQYAPWSYYGGLDPVVLGSPIIIDALERTSTNDPTSTIAFSKLVINQPNFSEIIPVVASSPAPTPPTYEVPTNAIHWKTEHAELKADGLLIAVGGKIFYSTPDQLQVTSLANVPNHMTFSVNWREHGVPMGLMFEMIKVDNGTRWYVSELEIRDGSAQGPYLKFDRWSYQNFPEPYTFSSLTNRSNDPERRIFLSINNLSLQGFLHEMPVPTPTSTLSADINKDGKVNLIDYSILSIHFLKDGTYEQGDINLDGKVNLVDYSIWSSQLPR